MSLELFTGNFTGSPDQMAQWFDIDAQWARDWRSALGKLQEPALLAALPGLNYFETLCGICARGLRYAGKNYTAELANILLALDIDYMATVDKLENTDVLDSELLQLEEIRTRYFPDDVFPSHDQLTIDIIPYLPVSLKTEHTVFNADVRWTNKGLSYLAVLQLLYPRESSGFLWQNIATFISSVVCLERYRLAVLFQTPLDVAYINSLEWADGMWWMNVYNLTGWNGTGMIASRLLRSATR